MQPYWTDGKATLYHGDVREVLRTLPEASVQCVVTSPPYFGLRDYGLPPSVWGGDPGCAHEWQDASWRPARWGDCDDDNPGNKQRTNGGSLGHRGAVKRQSTCGKCGAWLGCFGLEPTPDMYVANAVEVFREVRRVLRDDGTLWLNLGASYAASSGKGSNHGLESGSSEHGTAVNGNEGETFMLRDDLTTDEIAYVLAELSRHVQGAEVAEPDFPIGVDPTIARLADRKEV